MSTKQWHERRKPTPENQVLCWMDGDIKGDATIIVGVNEYGNCVDTYGREWHFAEPVTPIDQYTYWPGGECPVAGDTVVDVIYRGGRLDTNSRQQAKFRNWNHSLEEFDIIAYRIHVED